MGHGLDGPANALKSRAWLNRRSPRRGIAGHEFQCIGLGRTRIVRRLIEEPKARGRGIFSSSLVLEGRRTRRCAIDEIVPMQTRGARSLVRRVLFRPMRHGKGSHEGKTGAIRFAPREDMERETHPDHLDRHFERHLSLVSKRPRHSATRLATSRPHPAISTIVTASLLSPARNWRSTATWRGSRGRRGAARRCRRRG